MFFRILIWSVIFFFVARFFWRLLSPFLKPSQPNRQSDDVTAPPARKEEFKDVRDAKFIDVPKSSDEHGKEETER